MIACFKSYLPEDLEDPKVKIGVSIAFTVDLLFRRHPWDQGRCP